MNHIELFSGCGGLSLGLDHAGFELVLANELSPMAAESFSYNFFNEDLTELGQKENKPINTLWINSNHKSLTPRLRENPFTFPPFGEEGYSDLPNDLSTLKGKLIVGSIVELNKWLDSSPKLATLLHSAFGENGGLDLVSGGPPCQSFSLAGLRKKDCEKNTLPWEFAKFVQHTKPKIALLENVSGILRAFSDDNGNKFHAWYEVAKAFASIGYIPLCLHINARFAGIAQNRPRFIMIALREDHFNSLFDDKCKKNKNYELFKPSLNFFKLVQKEGSSLPFGHLDYLDVTKDKSAFMGSFLEPLVSNPSVSVKEALDDLKKHNPSQPSKFIVNLNNTFTNLKSVPVLLNHEFRKNSELVQRRFRLYQILQSIGSNQVIQSVFAILKGNAVQLDDTTWNECKPFQFLQSDNTLRKFHTKEDFEAYLIAHPTKKQTQKALSENEPAPAALSIPDDACHYDTNELRVLTVREMARIQSFPDNFVFRSKITTGGQMRKFEVPQYTQVGNAVPPLMGLKLGYCISELL